jgi:hypothetical protein
MCTEKMPHEDWQEDGCLQANQKGSEINSSDTLILNFQPREEL